MGECFKDIQHRTKGNQDPLQGMVADTLVTSQPAAETQIEGGKEGEPPAQAADSQAGPNDSGNSSSSSSSQGEGSSSTGGSSSSNGEGEQESSSGADGQAEASAAPAATLLKRGKAKKPHRRKAGS